MDCVRSPGHDSFFFLLTAINQESNKKSFFTFNKLHLANNVECQKNAKATAEGEKEWRQREKGRRIVCMQMMVTYGDDTRDDKEGLREESA